MTDKPTFMIFCEIPENIEPLEDAAEVDMTEEQKQTQQYNLAFFKGAVEALEDILYFDASFGEAGAEISSLLYFVRESIVENKDAIKTIEDDMKDKSATLKEKSIIHVS